MARKLEGVVADACARACERDGVESDKHLKAEFRIQNPEPRRRRKAASAFHSDSWILDSEFCFSLDSYLRRCGRVAACEARAAGRDCDDHGNVACSCERCGQRYVYLVRAGRVRRRYC